MKISRNISNERILNNISELFFGDVSIWLTFAKNKIGTFKEFCDVLRNRFVASNYKQNILHYCSQSSEESVIIYEAYMTGLYNKLFSKLTEYC